MLAMLLTSAVTTEAATEAGAMDFTWLFIKMVLVLVIVCVGAIIFLKYVLPRLGVSGASKRGRYFSILGRCRLETRKNLYMVEVGGRYFVIGCADHGINLIAELSEEEALGGYGSPEAKK